MFMRDREMFALLIIFGISAQDIFAYNIDIDKALIFKGIPSGKFGVSVEIINRRDENFVVVGAPHLENNLNKRPGGAFSCKIIPENLVTNAEDNCQPMRFNETEKDGSGIGSTIYKRNNSVVVCFPRKKYLNSDYKTLGGCREFDKNLESSKLLTYRVGTNDSKWSSSTFGFSVVGNIKDTELVVGGPNGCGNNGVLSVFLDNKADNIRNVGHKINPKDVNCTRITGGEYYGYAIDVGNFNNGHEMFVVGRPGFANAKGNIGSVEIVKINVATKQTIKQKEFEGHQLGGGFGQTICVTDINGDSLDDAIIGAPLEYVYQSGISSSNSHIFGDVGKVYIYLGSSRSDKIISDSSTPLTGDLVSGGRFGTSIASLGDINDDGITDIAVGAPYDNSGGSVYIFNGKKDVHKMKYSQRITAKSVHTDLSAFGFYISRSPEDIDGNQYKDFAVGAYRSNMVSILRTRSIVEFHTNISFNPDPVFLNSSGLQCSKGSDLPCFIVKVCFTVKGRGVSRGVSINFTVSGDLSMSRKRIILGGENSTIMIPNFTVKPDKPYCNDIVANVQNVGTRFFKAVDKPIISEVSLKLSGQVPAAEVMPILKDGSTTRTQAQVSFKTSCNSADRCNPKFTIMISADSDVIIERNEEFGINLTVRNYGDPADDIIIEVIKYKNTVFSGFLTFVHLGSENVKCQERNSTVTSCDVIPGTLIPHQFVNVSLFFRVDNKLSGAESLRGYIELGARVRYKSNSPTYKYSQTERKRLSRISMITLSGKSDEDQIELSQISSTSFLHQLRFNVFNSGPSSLAEVILNVSIPQSYDGFEFLNEISLLNGTCRIVQDMKHDVILEKQYEGESSPVIQPGKELSLNLSCDTNKVICSNVICDLKDIGENQEKDIDITLNISSRILLSLLENTDTAIVKYITKGILQLPDKSVFKGQLQTGGKGEITLTLFSRSITLPSHQIDLWVVVGGSVGGFVFLVILGIVLWKVGFFKRKKREEVQDYRRRTAMMRRQSKMSKMSRDSH